MISQNYMASSFETHHWDIDATAVVEEAVVFRPLRGSEGAGGRLP